MQPSSTNCQSWSSFHERLHQKLLATPDLLPKGATLLLAISGGQDSMAMLGLLSDLRRIHNWQLFIWHGDHAWHDYSTEIASGLENWCKEKHFQFFCDRDNLNQAKNESSARNWRYHQLAATIQKLSKINIKCSHVITAHTGSDQTETLLLNLSRGTDLSGMCSLRETRPLDEKMYGNDVTLVRPMFEFNRQETQEICAKLNLPIWLDPSNESKEYKRNRIRHEVIPVLEEIFPGCSLRIASLTNRLKNYKEDQNELTFLALQSGLKPEGIARSIFFDISETSRAKILSLWLQKNNVPSQTSKKLMNLSRRIGAQKAPGSVNLTNGWVVKWNKEIVSLIRNNQQSAMN